MLKAAVCRLAVAAEKGKGASEENEKEKVCR